MNNQIQPGANVRYIGWQPPEADKIAGVVVIVSGRSALVQCGDFTKWVDIRNLEQVS